MSISLVLLVAVAAFAAGALVIWVVYRSGASARTGSEADQRVRDAFSAIAAEALKSSNERFLELAAVKFGELQGRASEELAGRQRAVDDLLVPVREALEKVQSRMHDLDTARARTQADLSGMLRTMLEGQERLALETQRLASTMNASATRGRWGEMQLRRICEMAGMLDRCDFIEQEQSQGATGALRPDLKILVPGGRVIIVDAKVPFAAFDAAIAATDEETRAARLRDHAAAVRGHMKTLASRAYVSQIADAMEFVVMFMPGEMLFSAALQQDPELLTFGMEQRVIPASPTTLIALLRAIAYGWQQDALATNAKEISELGRVLHDRLRTFAAHHANLRRHLDAAVREYNKTVGSLETSVMSAARRFTTLGVQTGAPIRAIEPIETQARVLDLPDMPSLIDPESATLPPSSSERPIPA